MISCPERERLRRRTLENLARTDWEDNPVHVEMDESTGDDRRQRQARCARQALAIGLQGNADYFLLLEDDLEFNRFFRHNLLHWRPLRNGSVTLASVYNPGIRELACDLASRARIVSPSAIFGSQAFLLSRTTAHFVLRNWNRVAGMQDIKISRLAGRLKKPILYHAPSLVQHVGTKSLWGGKFHQAMDFDPDWKAQ